MAVKLRYELQVAGWAECTVEIDEQRATVTASYLSDALGDLCAATVALLRGEPSATATFAEEPGEFRWQFDIQNGDQLRIRIYWNEVEAHWSNGIPDPSAPIFDGLCQLRTFAGQVVAELQRLLREYGETGYRERWVLSDFPTKRLEQLESLLSDGAGGRLTSA
jgi:hypothetical protein